jgi:hypothetical protein
MSTTTENKEYRLLIVRGDVEPQITPAVYRGRPGVLRAARAHRKADTKRDDGLYPIFIDWKSRQFDIGCFSGGELQDSEDSE